MSAVKHTPATPLPTFAEIADYRIQEAPQGTRTIAIKVAINTARMMVEAEDKQRKSYTRLVEALRGSLELIYSAGDLADSASYKNADALLRSLGELS